PEHLRQGVEKVCAGGLERLDGSQPRLVRQAERVFVVEFESAAQPFVTAVTEQQAEIERLAFPDLVAYIARLVVHRVIAHADRIKSAETRQAIPAMLDLDAVQRFGRLQFDPAFKHGRFGPPIAFKTHFAQVDLRTGLDSSQQIDQDIRRVGLAANRRDLDGGIWKALSILIGAQVLAEVLQPETRI